MAKHETPRVRMTDITYCTGDPVTVKFDPDTDPFNGHIVSVGSKILFVHVEGGAGMRLSVTPLQVRHGHNVKFTYIKRNGRSNRYSRSEGA